MIQGYNEAECRALHPELKQVFEENENQSESHTQNKVEDRDIARGQDKQQ